MEKTKDLSIAIATYNEAANLRECLSAVADLDAEIVVVDGGSSDGTRDVARGFGAKVIKTDNPAMFHINKQKALENCSRDWILQLDADEIVTQDLSGEISETISGNPRESGFYIPRKNYFLGAWLKKGGQYPDHVIRLVRRGKARFPCKSVHEQIAVDGIVGYLSKPLIHKSFPDLPTYFDKAVRYAALTAQELKSDPGASGITGAVRYLIVKPAVTFLSILILNKGVLDGWRGLLYAYFSAMHFPYAYVLAKLNRIPVNHHTV